MSKVEFNTRSTDSNTHCKRACRAIAHRSSERGLLESECRLTRVHIPKTRLATRDRARLSLEPQRSRLSASANTKTSPAACVVKHRTGRRPIRNRHQTRKTNSRLEIALDRASQTTRSSSAISWKASRPQNFYLQAVSRQPSPLGWLQSFHQRFVGQAP